MSVVLDRLHDLLHICVLLAVLAILELNLVLRHGSRVRYSRIAHDRVPPADCGFQLMWHVKSSHRQETRDA